MRTTRLKTQMNKWMRSKQNFTLHLSFECVKIKLSIEFFTKVILIQTSETFNDYDAFPYMNIEFFSFESWNM